MYEWTDGCKYVRTDGQMEDNSKKMYDKEIASKVQVLYGGSVNASNANVLFNMDNIDGGLVGGASLKDEFINS